MDFYQCCKLLLIKKFLLVSSDLLIGLYLIAFSPEKPSIQTCCVSFEGWGPYTVESKSLIWPSEVKTLVASWAQERVVPGLAYHKEHSQVQASTVDSYKWVICFVVETPCERWAGWVIGILFLELLFIPLLLGQRNKRWFTLRNFGLMPDLPSQAGEIVTSEEGRRLDSLQGAHSFLQHVC